MFRNVYTNQKKTGACFQLQQVTILLNKSLQSKCKLFEKR